MMNPQILLSGDVVFNFFYGCSGRSLGKLGRHMTPLPDLATSI